MFGLDLFELLVIAFMAVAGIGFVVLVVFFAVRSARTREVARLAGVDTAEGQAQALRSVVGGFAAQVGTQVPAAAQSIEARLQELDSLRARGVISYDEYAAARQRAIDGRPAT